MEDFEKFWKTYPKKVAKAEARKAWAQTEQIRPPIEKLLAAILSPDIVNDKPWHQTWTGIQQKGAELGIKEDSFATPVEFKAAVMRAAMRAA
ncbi:MAG: hypothetical protein EBZ49_11180 [Proteobacteria bacterium]|nr:hypothetical protein [Pseudomonadota bacterium]